MAKNTYGIYIPSESRKFGGEWFSLAWWTGFSPKSRANQVKKAIKQVGPYQVRIVKAGGAYYIYTRPALTREDSHRVVGLVR